MTSIRRSPGRVAHDDLADGTPRLGVARNDAIGTIRPRRRRLPPC